MSEVRETLEGTVQEDGTVLVSSGTKYRLKSCQGPHSLDTYSTTFEAAICRIFCAKVTGGIFSAECIRI